MAKKNVKRDVKLLAKLNNEKLAEIWGILNNWGWPKEIPDPETSERDKNGRIFRRNSRRSILMDWINNTIGRKECLRYWNVTKSKRMTNEEFEKWWIINSMI